MTELPEPAGQLFDLDTADYTEAAYTKAQMLQFRRDALDEAAELCYGMRYQVYVYGGECADAIRKLKDET